MICEKCHAGNMIEYERKVGIGDNSTLLKGSRCDRCGFTLLENDEDVWSSVGL